MYQNNQDQRKVKTWVKKDKDFLLNNIHTLSISDLCRQLGRNERSVRLFLHRNKFEPRLLKDTLLLRILKLKFVDPTLFNPNRDFYQKIKIGQKRFSSILKGSSVMKDEECKRITDFFDIPYESVQEIRQLELFEQQESNM